MFCPVQIKNECVGVEDINLINRNSDGGKHQVFVNQDVDYRYHQIPQFWDHTGSISYQQSYLLQTDGQRTKNEAQEQQNAPQTEETGSLTYVKEYLQNGLLLQLQTEECRNYLLVQPGQEGQAQTSQQGSQPIPQPVQQPKTDVPVSNAPVMNQTRPGRPPKSQDSVPGKRLKCQCEICFKEFGHKSNLFIHMRTHNGERPYKCNQCEKCFTHSGNLAIHMRTHSGERPYGCQVCGKMFSHSGNLSTHLRTHSGVKPYKCGVCAKEFRHSGNLSIHKRIHSGVKPFICAVCGKDFYHSGNLTTHMKKHSVPREQRSDDKQQRPDRSSITQATAKIMPNANSIVPIKHESNEECTTPGILSSM